MTIITPVFLAGGTGTRLWPVSRKSVPKQFINLDNRNTLFQQALQRAVNNEIFKPPLILTNEDYRFLVKSQIENINIEPGAIILEPSSRDTAASILAASIYSEICGPGSILLVMPTDHHIRDLPLFEKTIINGYHALDPEHIITFGIDAKEYETGYGYIQVAREEKAIAKNVVSFTEKPSLDEVKLMVDSGDFLWNSGIFLFRASDMIKVFEAKMPELCEQVTKSVHKLSRDLGFCRVNKEEWDSCQAISIDYAVMQGHDKLKVLPFDGHWSDLGSWKSVKKELETGMSDVVIGGNACSQDCKNTMLYCTNDNQYLVGIGLENIIAVAMPDAVLVTHKDHMDSIKQVVNELREQGVGQSEEFSQDFRPWGSFEILTNGKHFQVKRIIVNPGCSLSLQSHKYRSEHWVVVEGLATVTVGDVVTELRNNESIYIPANTKHRLSNFDGFQLTLIEVQTGTYFGEDDIIRYEDVYKRS